MSPPALVACSSCSLHVKRGEGRCPHCGAAIASDGAAARTATAVLMGLTLSACPVVEPQPEYGVPATESATESATSTTEGTTEGTATEGATTTTSDTTTTTSSTTSATTMESTVTGEPEYGVPDTSPFAPERARE